MCMAIVCSGASDLKFRHCRAGLSHLRWLVLSLGLALMWSPSIATAQAPLTFDRILELVELEVKEEKLLSLIAVQPTVFTLSADQVSRLKTAGASDSVIAALSPKAKTMIRSDTSDYVIILDVSGSMKETSREGSSKWEVARKAACDLITNIPPGLSISIVVYGHNVNKPCDVEVIRPLAPLTEAEKVQIVARINGLEPSGKTPIGKSLQVAAEQVAASRGIAKLVLITDGIETCNGDPVANAAAFVAGAGEGRSVDVIGFDLPDQESSAVSLIAKSGKGRYTEAKTGVELAKAFESVKQEMSQVVKKSSAGFVKLKKSKDPTMPTVLPINSYTTSRYNPGEQNYWQVDFPAGKFTVVFDATASDDKPPVSGEAAIGTFNGSEFKVEKSVFISENVVRKREVINLSFAEATSKLIRVSASKLSDLTDYQIGVFAEKTEFGVPFLVNSAEVLPLTLGQQVTSPLLGLDPAFFKDRCVVYKIVLPAGDFKVDCKWIKESGNKRDGIRSISALDEQGVFKTQVVGTTLETQATATLKTADEQTILLEVSSGTPREKVIISVTEIEN